jgi:hypothetical protein
MEKSLDGGVQKHGEKQKGTRKHRRQIIQTCSSMTMSSMSIMGLDGSQGLFTEAWTGLNVNI